MIKLRELVEEITKHKRDSDEFIKTLAAIQDQFGQKDGGLASLYFSDRTEGFWDNWTTSQKRELMSEYLRAEFRELLSYE